MNSLENNYVIDDYADEQISNSQKNSVEEYNESYNIDTYTNAIPVERLIADFVNGIIEIPPFQRKYVWAKVDNKTARHRPSLFIDSVLQGLPIPPIIIYRDASSREKGLLIDGQQRLVTLAWYKTGVLLKQKKQFKLHGEGIFTKWNNKTFEDLDEKYQNYFLRAYIPVTYVRQLNEDIPPLPKASSLYVLFDRLNSGGVALTPHEKRSVLTIYNKQHKTFEEFFTKIYKYEEWKDISAYLNCSLENEKSAKAQELIFRIYAFYLYREYYQGNVSKFLDMFTLKYELSKENSEKLQAATKKILKKIFEAKIQDIFRPKGSFNTSLFEIFMVTLFSLNEESHDITVDQLKEIYELCADKEIYDPTGRSIKSKEEVLNRFKKAYESAVAHV